MTGVRLRVDETHSNVAARWRELGCPQWPDERQWAELAAADRLDEYEPERRIAGGTAELTVELPMPAISYLELRPE